MSLDLSSIPPEARLDFIRIGRRWNSAHTLAQATDTLQALGTYGTLLADHGFSAEDALRLAAARNALADKLSDSARGGELPPKVTSRAYLDAMHEGKRVRNLARTILVSVEDLFAKRRGAAAESVRRQLSIVLGQTQSAGADDGALLHQLEILEQALRDPVIGAEAVSRGGLFALREIERAIVTLRAIAVPCPTLSQELSDADERDLLDGLIVSLVRSARRAARIAASWTGNPDLAKAFELTRLYANDENPLGLLKEPEPDPRDYGLPSRNKPS